MSFSAMWMGLEIIIVSKVSQSEKDKYYMISLILDSKKIVQMSLFTKQKHNHRHRKQTYGYRKHLKGKEAED